MNPYALLGAAIVSELIGTTSLKLSEGFSRPIPSFGVVVGYRLNRRNTTPFTAWIRAVTLGNVPPFKRPP